MYFICFYPIYTELAIFFSEIWYAECVDDTSDFIKQKHELNIMVKKEKWPSLY